MTMPVSRDVYVSAVLSVTTWFYANKVRDYVTWSFNLLNLKWVKSFLSHIPPLILFHRCLSIHTQTRKMTDRLRDMRYRENAKLPPFNLLTYHAQKIIYFPSHYGSFKRQWQTHPFRTKLVTSCRLAMLKTIKPSRHNGHERSTYNRLRNRW